jgi:hypothetical protein
MNDDVLEKMNFIERTFNDLNELSKESAQKLADCLADVCFSYDKLTMYYNNTKEERLYL